MRPASNMAMGSGDVFFVRSNGLFGLWPGLRGSGADAKFSSARLLLWLAHTSLDRQSDGGSSFRCLSWGCMSFAGPKACAVSSYVFTTRNCGVGAREFKILLSWVIVFNNSGIVSGVLFQYCQFNV